MMILHGDTMILNATKFFEYDILCFKDTTKKLQVDWNWEPTIKNF